MSNSYVVSNAYALNVEPGYERLANVFQMALDRAQLGKGKERHANNKPFLDQPLFDIREMVGAGFTKGQAIKKILESETMEDVDARNELLDAMVYLAGEVLYLWGKFGYDYGEGE